MIIMKNDNENRFRSIFNTITGDYVRSGVIDEHGQETKEDPFMTSFPELIDIGIMGNCIHGKSGMCRASGVQCYQDGLNTAVKNMSLTDYKRIIDECTGKTFQVALGGRGDTDQHKEFAEILRYARGKGIVPNYTTSGLGIKEEHAILSKQYCGAVAVSMYSRIEKTAELAVRHTPGIKHIYKSEADIPVRFAIDKGCYWDAPNYIIDGLEYSWGELHHMVYSDTPQEYEFIKVYRETQEPNYTFKAINTLLSHRVTTNIHFVLSKSSIDEAILRLKYKGFPNGINAVVFLMHKPVGLGQENEVLTLGNPRLVEFFNLIEHGEFGYKIGFDSCTVPGLLNMCKSVDRVSLETCEAARWSMYITSDMIALPCSFDNQSKVYGVDIKKAGSIKAAWDSPKFEAVRKTLASRCKGCSDKADCLGGCPLMESITLCNRNERRAK